MPRTQPGPRLVAVALGLGALAIAGCSGKTTGASNYDAANNTIRLNAVGSCDTSCTAFIRYRVVGASAWTNTPSFTVPNKVTNAPWSRTVTISRETRYEYQACGKESSQSGFTCVGPDGTTGTTERFTAAAVTCGQVITQTTIIAYGLNDCPGDGLRIGAPNITLDLNDNLVSGDGNVETLCSGPGVGDYGIDNSAGHDGVTIKNGRLMGFEQGVVLVNAHDNVVHDVAISGSQVFCQGVYSNGGDRVQVRHTSVFDARVRNIAVEAANAAVIESNTLSNPDHVGIALVATNSRVASNTVSSSTGVTDFAIELLAGGNNEVVGNRVDGADGDGIIMARGSHDNFVALNTVSNVRNDEDPSDPGQFAGIEVVDGGARNRIVSNLLFGNQAPGIAIGRRCRVPAPRATPRCRPTRCATTQATASSWGPWARARSSEATPHCATATTASTWTSRERRSPPTPPTRTPIGASRPSRE